MNPIISPSFPTEEVYQRYLAALLAGDRRQCRAVFESWLGSNIELCRLYQGVVQRSLYEVGQLWERGRVSVATEHLATAITESLLNLVYPRLFSQPRVGKSAVVTCALNEYHQVGGKMVADIFELHGWRGHFLGANTPDKDLIDLIQDKQPNAVAFSLTMFFNQESLLRKANAVRAQFPAVPILVGGQAFRWGGVERVREIEGAHYLASLDDLESWMNLSATRAN